MEVGWPGDDDHSLTADWHAAPAAARRPPSAARRPPSAGRPDADLLAELMTQGASDRAQVAGRGAIFLVIY